MTLAELSAGPHVAIPPSRRQEPEEHRLVPGAVETRGQEEVVRRDGK